MPVTKAIVREPGSRFSRCISTHPQRHTVDPDLARTQHSRYVSTIRELGLEVIPLERDDLHPDSCFVEDTAVVHEDRALICLPAEESRRGETKSVEELLSKLVRVRRAIGPGTVEGGDVLHLKDRLVCGITRRTNEAGASQLSEWLGVKVDTVTDPKTMHLKSHVSHLNEDTILVTGAFAEEAAFDRLEKVIVPPGEEYAANVLSVNGTIVMPDGFPRTRTVLKDAGLDVITLQMTEFPKCDGAMTCLSILI